MSIHFHLSFVTSEYDKYLPGLSQKPKYALWLRSSDWDFQPDDLQDLQQAFAPLKGIAWYAVAKTNNEGYKGISKPFEEWQGLVDEAISENVLTLLSVDKMIFSGVGWLSDEGYKIMPKFLQRRPLYGQGVISFIPNDKSNAINWAKIIQGPGWLWLCRDWIANSPKPSLDADAVTLSYVNLTQEINGASSLIWVDSDRKTGLIFFGSEDVLTTVSNHLSKKVNFVEDASLFDRISARGFSFEMCK